MVLIGIGEKAVDAFYKAIVSKDETGIEELVNAGQLFGVPVGAKVKVLGAHGFFGSTLEVRILEGRYKGRRGFVSSSLVAGKSESPKSTPTPGLSPIFENDDN